MEQLYEQLDRNASSCIIKAGDMKPSKETNGGPSPCGSTGQGLPWSLAERC